jgi:transposase-like protein
MYSYEDRIRAVELYIKLGKRVRPTIRQLGYPTKNSLKGWYNEYQRKLDLPAGYAGRETQVLAGAKKRQLSSTTSLTTAALLPP